jgi:hypothetical protein
VFATLPVVTSQQSSLSISPGTCAQEGISGIILGVDECLQQFRQPGYYKVCSNALLIFFIVFYFSFLFAVLFIFSVFLRTRCFILGKAST